jgi:hypothetical protein
MTDTKPFVSEGLIEFLQAIAPQWATKLTMERMTFVRLVADATRRAEKLKALLLEAVYRGIEHPGECYGPDGCQCGVGCFLDSVRQETDENHEQLS